MYELRPPAPPLRPFIEHYWFVRPDKDRPVDLRVDVFVDARADLIFNFGAPYERRWGADRPVKHRKSNLDAQRLTPIRITQRGAVRTTGVRFLLGGVGPFVREPLAQWTNRTPPPAEVFGADATTLERALAKTSSVDAQAALLDAFFTRALLLDDAHAVFSRALRHLTHTGEDTVAAAAKAARTTTRQVERLFARFLGIPPKTVARVLRFQASLRRLMTDPGCTLAEVAAQAGYFDQAHFIREFRRFSGGVPRGYRGYFPEAGPTDFAPNVVAFVQDAPRRRRLRARPHSS